MSGRKISLYVLPSALYLKDTPVMIDDGALLMDRFYEYLTVRLSMRSMSEQEIISVTVRIRPYDALGIPYEEDTEYVFSGLKLKRDQVFGQNRQIPMPDNKARSFSVYVSSVAFSDYSTWENTMAFGTVGKARSLISALGGEEIARQYMTRYGNDCKVLPSDEEAIWYCTCGAVNHAEEERCHNCRRNRSALKNINYDSLKLEAERTAEREKIENAEEESRRQKKRDRGQKILKISLIILPILLVGALLAATVPGFLERREAYQYAGRLLEERKFEQARQTYLDLGDYLDARDKAEKEVDYQKARYLLSCARNADAAGLTLLNISRSDLPDGTDLSIYLYEQCIPLLEELGDYGDTAEMRKEIDMAMDEYAESLVYAAYRQAVETMEKGNYLAARDAFEALGDYRDSPAMMQECLYRRAAAYLDFCESNNMRNILLRISDTAEEKTLISMPGSTLTRLGSEAMMDLQRCFLGDGVEVLYEDEPSQEGLLPAFEAAEKEFSALGDYKDSAALAARAGEGGDYTGEFYALLQNGRFREALDWLNTYPEDEIPDRDSYAAWIEAFQPFQGAWTLHQGDSGLIPYSAGVEYTQLISFVPQISIEGDEAVMRISDEDGNYTATLRCALGETRFSASPDGTYYYALINQVDHFTYLWYSDNGMLSSCEYRRQ
ncbi:MAG: hypothetical protein IJI61_10840 [Oscillospiraceae bacterium]|nr:hypothetical protein [Oscillospiraceae bacterium]